MLTKQIIIYASAGGLFPALLWLLFWLREDKQNPEPRKILVWTFLGGTLAIIPTLLLQLLFEEFSQTFYALLGTSVFLITLLPVIINSAIEESMKFFACYFTALKRQSNNEPIDPVIYLITAALGFVAVENTLFITSAYLGAPIGEGLVLGAIVGNIRFVGASLLHVASSAIIGIFIGFAFYKSKKIKIMSAFVGLLLATALHTYFNFLIMKSGTGFLFSFPLVWIVIIILIFLLEKIKKIKK